MKSFLEDKKSNNGKELTVNIRIAPADLISVLKEKDLLADFIDDIPLDEKLLLLSKLTCDEALSYRDKPVKRKLSYLKTKMHILKKHIIDPVISRVAFLFWIDEFINKDKDDERIVVNYNPHDLTEMEQIDNKEEEAQNIDVKEEIDEKENNGEVFLDTVVLLHPIIKQLINNKAIWAAYLLSSIILFNNEINNDGENSISDLDYIAKFKQLDTLYLQGEISKFVKNIVHPDTIEPKINKLKEDCVVIGPQIITAGQELLEKGIIPSKEVINSLNTLNDDFLQIKDLIALATLLNEIKLDKNEKISDLNSLLQTFEFVRENYDRNEKEKMEINQVFELLDKAFLITPVNYSSLTEKEISDLEEFKKKITEERKIIEQEPLSEKSMDIRRTVLDYVHPLCLIIKAISSQKLSRNEIKEILEITGNYYNDTVADLTVQHLLFIEQKENIEIGTPEANYEELIETTVSESETPEIIHNLPQKNLIDCNGKDKETLTQDDCSSETLTDVHEEISDIKTEIETISSNITSIPVVNNEIIKYDKEQDDSIVIEVFDNKISGEFFDKNREEKTEREEPGTEIKNIEELKTLNNTNDENKESKEEIFLNQSSLDIARMLFESNDIIWSGKYEELILSLLEERKLSEAYWLARHFEKYKKEDSLLQTELIETIIISSFMQSDVDMWISDLYNLYQKIVPEIQKNFKEKKEIGYELIVFSSSLVPTLLAPGSGAISLFSIIQHLPSSLRDFHKKVLEFVSSGHHIIPDLLQAHLNQETWAKNLKELKKEVEKWLLKAEVKAIDYRPALNIWQIWMRPSGLIYELLQPVIKDDIDKIEHMRFRVSYLTSRLNIKKEIENTDNILRGRNRQPIVGIALDQLLSRTSEVVDFVGQWIKIYEQKPDNKLDWRIKAINDISKALLSNYNQIIEELNGLIKDHDNRLIKAGASLCINTLNIITELFKSPRSVFKGSIMKKRIFLTFLLKIPEINLNNEGEPENLGEESFIYPVLKSLFEPEKTWMEIFQAHTDKYNFKATECVIEHVRAEGNFKEAEKMQEENVKNLELCREHLAKLINSTINHIENAMLQAVLTDTERYALICRVERIEHKKAFIFKPLYEILNLVESEVNNLIKSSIQKGYKRLEYYKENIKQEDYQLIIKALENKDLATAYEYIAMVEQERPIRIKLQEEDTFSIFFPEQMNSLAVYLEEVNPFSIIDKLKEGNCHIGPINLWDIPGAQCKEASKAFDNWHKIKAKRTIENSDYEKIKQLFLYFGFYPKADFIKHIDNNDSRPGMHMWFRIQVDIPRCPVPAFGSSSQGEYMLLCTWSRPSEEEILDVTKQYANKAVIVFYFARFSELRRRDMAKLTRRWRRTLLVIDESLMLFLTRERGTRLDSLFKCAIPFSWSNPYTPFAAGEVPQEMFYGREEALLDIWNREGSCFIYGGRQLGKSALLRHAQRKFHDPSKGNIVIKIDLGAEGIDGETRKIQDLWLVLAKSFKEDDIIPQSMPLNASPEVMFSHMKKWLDDKAGRRLLLLLDEADNFLDQDSTAKECFSITQFLRGKMLQTNRRFKVVFAGLHNVQRFQKIPNQPLAHFGTPISIGPLEPKDAVNLILKPLEALGYRFKSQNLITRILSYTNYQPSLLQLFGDELVRNLSSSDFDIKVSPPYTITEKHLNDVYRNQNLRDRIRERFDWTLILDRRYKVIAYCVANRSVNNPELEDADFDIQWLLREAPYWWPPGFQNITYDEMKSLADEMIGLGVLIKTRDGLYKLRAQNVRRLLGTEDEIHQRLLEMEHEKPSTRFLINTFRQNLGNNILSPLTLLQESDLIKSENGIRLIIGTSSLLDINSIKLTLSKTIGLENVLILSNYGDDINIPIIKENLKRSERNHMIILVEASKMNNQVKFIQEMMDSLKRLYAADRTNKVVILFNQLDLYEWFKQKTYMRKQLEAEAFPVILTLWNDVCIQRWLDGQAIPNESIQVNSLLEITSGWPVLIMEITKFIKEQHKSLDEAIITLKTELSNPKSFISQKFKKEISCDQCLTSMELLRVLHELEEACTFVEISSFLKNSNLEEIENALEYLKRLNLIKDTEDGKLVVENTASSVLFLEK